MQQPKALSLCALGVALIACGAASGATSESLASVELRLITPLTSYASKPGSGFESVVVSSRHDNGRVFLPPGTIVRGEVRKRQTVGMGLIHERASLELEFNEYELADGRKFSFEAKLHSLDNARESVTREGRIEGVLAARTPHSYLAGLWHRPSIELFQKAFVGMTGASGKIASAASLGPIGAAAMFAIRCTLFRLAEPEIQLPPGSELRIDLMKVADDSPAFQQPEVMEVVPDLTEWLRTRPASVNKPNGTLARDIINFALAGSRDQVEAAFSAAGWAAAEPRNFRSMSRVYMAFNRQAGYPTAPTSKLLYQNAEPDLVFQKSLDTFAKRHHIRLWRVERDGEEMWLGAATQDIAIAMRGGSFTHLVHPKIDNERQKVVADLTFAGCSQGVGFVDRPALTQTRNDGTTIITDGRMAVVPLQQCTAPPMEVAEMPKVPHSGAFGLARRMILEGRYYILRSNVYYMTYDFFAWKRANRAMMTQALAE